MTRLRETCTGDGEFSLRVLACGSEVYMGKMVEMLLKNGDSYYRESLFYCAAITFEKALNEPTATETERIIAKYWLASSLRVLGRYRQALMHYAELYNVCKDKHELDGLASKAFQSSIQIRVNLHHMDILPADLHELLASADEGLQWLRDRGKEAHAHALLLDKSEILAALGDLQAALETAQEAFELEEKGKGGYYQGTYIALIAEYARKMGDFRYASKILEKVDEGVNDPHTMVQVLTEKLRLVHAMDPFDADAALDTAWQLRTYCTSIESPRKTIPAYCILACTFARVGRCTSMLDELQSMVAAAMSNRADTRAYHLRMCIAYAEKTRRYLEKEEGQCEKNDLKLIAGMIEMMSDGLEETQVDR